MADQDKDRPTRTANQEPAEGSRETVQDGGAANGERSGSGSGADAGGITNRPLSEEQGEQDDVPARGQRKDGGSHA